MNRALLNPFDLAELPKTIQEYLEQDKPSCMRFNRHGNLLGVGTQTGRVVIWDFDTRSVAAMLGDAERDLEYAVTSISFPAPHNASTVLVAYDPGMLRLFDTLSACIVCEIIFDTPIVQVESHPSIYDIALIVPRDSHPLQIHLRRGIYDACDVDIRSVVHPDVVLTIQKANDQRNIPGKVTSPRKDLPKRPKHAFGNKKIPSLPNIADALYMSVLCSPDEFENGKSLENGGGRRKMPFYIVFTRKDENILRGGPTGKVRAFKLIQKAGDIQTPIPTAECTSMVSIPGKAAIRSIVLARKHGKVLINSQDRVMRLYDVSQLLSSPVTTVISSGSNSIATDASPAVTIVENENTNINTDGSAKTPASSGNEPEQHLEINVDLTKNERETADENTSNDVAKSDDGVIEIDPSKPKHGKRRKKSRSKSRSTERTTTKDGNIRKPSAKSGPTLEPLTVFTEVVNKTQCTCACFSRDGDFVLGGMEGTEHRIQVWRTIDGHLEMTLEGPKEGIKEILFHPLRPILATLGKMNGCVYVWMKTFSENWSALAPEFCELEANEEYIEAEDEFDLKDPVSLQEQQAEREKAESGYVDVETCDHSGWFSSDSDEEDTYFYVPAEPNADKQEEEHKSLSGELISEQMGNARGERSTLFEDGSGNSFNLYNTNDGNGSTGRRKRYRGSDTTMIEGGISSGNSKGSRMRRGRNSTKRRQIDSTTSKEAEALVAAATAGSIQGKASRNGRNEHEEVREGGLQDINETDCILVEKRK